MSVLKGLIILCSLKSFHNKAKVYNCKYNSQHLIYIKSSDVRINKPSVYIKMYKTIYERIQLI